MATLIADTAELARRDPLTGVRNRLAWDEHLASVEHSDLPHALVLADVDRLKYTNDNFGYEAGDRLLVETARVLADAVTTCAGATLYRIGGDEFAMLIPAATETAIRHFERALESAFENGAPLEQGVAITASVGSGHAICGGHIRTALRAADVSMKQKKNERGLARA